MRAAMRRGRAGLGEEHEVGDGAERRRAGHQPVEADDVGEVDEARAERAGDEADLHPDGQPGRAEGPSRQRAVSSGTIAVAETRSPSTG